MKRLLTLLIALTVMAGAHAAIDTYFPYPTPPESLPLGRPRANYCVEHFWDHCPWKSAFSSHKKMQGAFQDYAEMMPLAAADTVYASIDKLIGNVKKRPADLLELAKMAEATFYADTAMMLNDMVYLPFAKAAAAHKKIPAENRAHFSRQVSVIEHSQKGMQLPPIMMKLKDGSEIALNDTTSGANEYVMIFDVPGSLETRLDLIRLKANISAKALIDGNVLKPVVVYAGTPTDEWWEQNSDLPENWMVGALPQAEDYIDLRVIPAIYVTDSSKQITDKFMDMTLLLRACDQIMDQLRREE